MITIVLAATIFLRRPKTLLSAPDVKVHIATRLHHSSKVGVCVDDVDKVSVTGVKPGVHVGQHWQRFHLHHPDKPGSPVYACWVEARYPLNPPTSVLLFLQFVRQEATDV